MKESEVSPYPKTVSKDWLIDIGVDKDNLKKASSLFVNDEVELNEGNLIALQQKAINVSLISNIMFVPLHRVSANQEMKESWGEFLKANTTSFEKFFHHRNVNDVRSSYNRKQKIDWQSFVQSDYKDWNEYQDKLLKNIGSFDNKTFYQQKEWKEEVVEARNGFRAVVARAMVEIIDGKAPIASVDVLQDFGFKTFQRDYVWATLGREFAITRFNVKKVMNSGFSLKSLVDTQTLHSNEPTSFLRSVRYGELSQTFDRRGLYLTREEEVGYMKDIFVSTTIPESNLL